MLIPVHGAHVPRSPSNGAYGVRRTPTHVHQGIDLGAPEGATVRAAASGTVARVIDDPGTVGFRGYGRCVVLRHAVSTGGSIYTLYAHLSSIDPDLTVGELVSIGDAIGRVGDTCDTRSDPDHRCQGPHLHFEVSRTAYPQKSEAPRLDPTFFLRGTL